MNKLHENTFMIAIHSDRINIRYAYKEKNEPWTCHNFGSIPSSVFADASVLAFFYDLTGRDCSRYVLPCSLKV